MKLFATKRDDKGISRLLTKKGEKSIASDDLYIIFPDRFITVGLASFSREISLFGSFIVGNDDFYSLVTFPVRFSLSPTSIEDIDYEGKPYKKLLYRKGDVVMASMEGIPIKDDIYLSLSEFIIKSNNKPPYVNYEDLMKLFIRGSELMGVNLGGSIVDIALYVSVIARDSKNRYVREKHSRDEINKMDDIAYIGLTDYDKGLTNVASLISGGAYLNKGLTTALTMEDPPETELGKVLSK